MTDTIKYLRYDTDNFRRKYSCDRIWNYWINISIIGFIIALVQIISQKAEMISLKSNLRKANDELDILRNQNLDDDLVLIDENLDDEL